MLWKSSFSSRRSSRNTSSNDAPFCLVVVVVFVTIMGSWSNVPIASGFIPFLQNEQRSSSPIPNNINCKHNFDTCHVRRRRRHQKWEISSSSSSLENNNSDDFTETDSGLYVPETFIQQDEQEERRTTLLTTLSKSGISYQDVLNGIDTLFPPDGLDQRTALSRKDGYWPFISKGNEPPKEFVYGEFDVLFFAQVLDHACTLFDTNNKNNANADNWSNKVFCDLGSGTGRLVLAAAALHSWKLCRGIELLPGIHDAAEHNLEQCRIRGNGNDNNNNNNNGIETTTITPTTTTSSSRTATGGPTATATPTITDTTAAGDENSKWQQVYLQQYRNSIPNNDDWLNQLSGSLEEEEEDLAIMDEAVDSNELEGVEPNLHIEESAVSTEDDDSNSNDEPTGSTQVPVIYPDDTGEYALPSSSSSSSSSSNLRLAPIELSCGSMDDPYEYFGDADCVFVFSTAMPPDIIAMISRAVGRQCQPGTIVITSEYQLPLEGYLDPQPENDPALPGGEYQLELIEELTGDCWCTGGVSTVFFHRVVKSLWDGPYRRMKPTSTITEEGEVISEAKRVGQALDAWGMPTDSSN